MKEEFTKFNLNSQIWCNSSPSTAVAPAGAQGRLPSTSYLPMGIHQLLLQGRHSL